MQDKKSIEITLSDLGGRMMKKKTLASIFAFTAVATTVGAGMVSQGTVAKDNSNNNEVLLTQNDGGNNTNKVSNTEATTTNNTQNSQTTGMAVVINGNGSLALMGSNSVKSNLVGYLSAGEMLTVHGQDGNWYKVTVQETGETGYINAANLQFIESGVNDPLSILKGNGQVINVSSNLRIRAAATMDSNTIGHLLNGSSFKIVGKEGQWYKINANGVTGFVYSEYVAPSIINAVSNGGNTGNSTVNNNIITNKAKAVSEANSVSKATSSNSSVANNNSKEVTSTNSTVAKTVNNSTAKATVATNSTSTVNNSTSKVEANSKAEASSSVKNGNATATSNSTASATTKSGSEATATASSKATANATTKNGSEVTATASSKATAKGTTVVGNNVLLSGPAHHENNESVKSNVSNSQLYNEIYNIVKANFWTNSNTEGSTMSMNMNQTYNKDGVNYYSVYVHTTNSDNGEANTAHYYISTNGTILNGNAFSNSNAQGAKQNPSQVKEEVSTIASEYLNGQVNSGNLVYNIDMNNTTESNGSTFYAVQVYNGSVNSNNYISTIYVSPNGQVLGSLPKQNNNTNNNHKIVKRTRSTADVVNK